MRMRTYTGPVGVKDMAEKIREAGIKVTIEGTEHVYFECSNQYAFAGALRAKHGHTFGLTAENLES